MPIADCGFPGSVQIQGTDPPQTVSGRDLLIQNGPTAWVEIGFNADLFHPDGAVVQRAIATVHAQAIPDQLMPALPLIDRQQGSGIGGTEQFNLYLGHIRIAALGFIQYGRFMGVRLAAGQQPHRALLGRTLLQGMLLVYDGREGSVRLAV